MKSAAAYPSDMYEDENKFQGRKPGQPVNRGGGGEDQQFKGGSRAPPVVVVDEMTDPREQHVILDDYDNYMNDFFQPPVPPHGPPPPPHQQRRSGPSVYTPEEEALIASMGGRGGRPTTQEFAGLGTMMNKKGTAVPSQQYESKMPIDPQQQNYNPEQDFIPPPPPIMPPIPPPPPFAPPGAEEQFLRREEGYLGDITPSPSPTSPMYLPHGVHPYPSTPSHDWVIWSRENKPLPSWRRYIHWILPSCTVAIRRII